MANAFKMGCAAPQPINGVDARTFVEIAVAAKLIETVGLAEQRDLEKNQNPLCSNRPQAAIEFALQTLKHTVKYGC